jgi:hypothetical protein
MKPVFSFKVRSLSRPAVGFVNGQLCTAKLCPPASIVAVTGDHVPSAADVNEVNGRKAGNELVGSLLSS